MVNPIVSEILNAARRKVELNRRATEIVRRAGPLVRQAMEERATAREAATNARTAPKPSTQAPATSVVDDTSVVLPEPSRRSNGPIDQQQQLQQQQRIFGGERGVENALLEGDDEAIDIAGSMVESRMRSRDAELMDAGTTEKRNQYAEASSSFDERGTFVSPEDQGIRFEIDDGLSRINPNYARRLQSEPPPLPATGKGWDSVEGNSYRALPDSKTEVASLRLGDIFEHTELARFYPEYKNIKIARVPEGSRSEGTYNPNTNTMHLRTFYGDEEQVRSTIIHELQHYVQKEEGFARGGSLNEFIRPEDLDGARSIDERRNNLKARLTTVEDMVKNNPSNNTFKSLRSNLEAEINMVDEIIKDAYKKYRRVTGEKEAFDAERRLRMSPIEKSLVQPELATRELMDDAITLKQGETVQGNIVPGMSFENDHIVFHGGPVSAIDKFMLKYIGTGEGAIARGWGFYFAERPGISVGYRQGRASQKFNRGERYTYLQFKINLPFKERGDRHVALVEAVRTSARDIETNQFISPQTHYSAMLDTKTRFFGSFPGINSQSEFKSVGDWLAQAIESATFGEGKMRNAPTLKDVAFTIVNRMERYIDRHLKDLETTQSYLSDFITYLATEMELVKSNIEQGLTPDQWKSLTDDGVLALLSINDSLLEGFKKNFIEPRKEAQGDFNHPENIFSMIIGDAKRKVYDAEPIVYRGTEFSKEQMRARVDRFIAGLQEAIQNFTVWGKEEVEFLKNLHKTNVSLDWIVEGALKDSGLFNFIGPNKEPLSNDAGLFVLDLKANQHKDYLHLDKPMTEQPAKIKKIMLDVSVDKTLDGRGEDVVRSLAGFIWDRLRRTQDESVLYPFTQKGKEGVRRAYRLTMDTLQPNEIRWANEKFASLVLKEWGIPGSAHWDIKSRDPGLKIRTNNYVIWDEDIIEQLAVQPFSWRNRGHLEVDPADHPLTDEYKPQ